MKTLFFYLFLLISVNTVFSQQYIEENKDVLEGELWTLDSLHYYEGNVDVDLYLKFREIVTSRNNRGNITSGFSLSRRDGEATWKNASRFTQSYYNNAKKNEYKLQIYDNERNIWIDSSRYKKYNNLGLLTVDISFGYDKKFGIFTYGNKILKNYNSDKKVIEKKSLTWDIDRHKWVNNKLELTEYTANSNAKKLVLKIWSKEADTWVNIEKKEWKYNSDNALIEYISINWLNDNWVNSFKKSIEYTSNGKIQMKLNQNWDASEDRWVNEVKYLYEYDGVNLVNALKQQWIAKDNKWKDLTLEINKYNDENLLIDNLIYYYPMDSTEELTGIKYLNYYNADKKLSLKLKKKWNQENNDWENIGKWVYDYNHDKTTVFSEWDEDKMEWVNNYFYKYVYDTSGRTILKIKKEWNLEENIWVNDYKFEKEYDDFNHLVKNNYFTWKSNRWIHIKKRHYFWSKYNTDNIDENSVDDFLIFPNPAYDVLNLSYDLSKSIDNLKIYSLNGDKVLEVSRPSYDKIDISLLANGAYVLRINTNRGIVSKPFVVEK